MQKFNSIHNFVQQLSLYPSGTTVFNPYYGKEDESNIRRYNLTLYLQQMTTLNPSVLLMGEAPGYKGCRKTGVPFSSEHLLQHHPFFKQRAYHFIPSGEPPTKENSATMIWDELQHWKRPPLVWNSYPYHPHLPDQATTNRSPRQQEILEGRVLLKQLMTLFNIEHIIAVGRKAEQQAHQMQLNHTYVRHPSFGGKQAFKQGMKRLWNERG